LKEEIAQLNRIVKEKTIVENQFKRLLPEMNALSDEVKLLEVQNATLKQEIQTLQQRQEAQYQKHSRIDLESITEPVQMANLQTQIKNLQLEVAEVTERCQTYKDHAITAQEALSEVTDSKTKMAQDFQTKSQESAQKIAGLSDALAELANKLDSERTNSQHLQTKLNESVTKNTFLGQEKNSLQSELRNMEPLLQAKEQELTQLRSTIDNLNSKFNSSEDYLILSTRLSNEKADLQRDFNDFKTQSQNSNNQLQQKIANLQMENQVLHKQLKEGGKAQFSSNMTDSESDILTGTAPLMTGEDFIKDNLIRELQEADFSKS